MAGPDFPSCQPLPQLPTGGYDDDYFVDPAPKSLHCPVCLLVLREPHLISCCGAHICQVIQFTYTLIDYHAYLLTFYIFQVCIESIQSNELSCPCCRSQNYINVLNKEKRGKVLELNIRCINSAKGCEWVGELGDHDRHCSSTCQYEEAVCQYGCGGSYSRFMLNKHEQDECPERPIDMKMATFTRQMMDKVSSLETKYEREITALQQKLEDQEERHAIELKTLKKEDLHHQIETIQNITEKEVLLQLDGRMEVYTAAHNNCNKEQEDMRQKLTSLERRTEALQNQVEQYENERKAFQMKLENDNQEIQQRIQERAKIIKTQQAEEISNLKQEISDLKGNIAFHEYSENLGILFLYKI